MSRSHNRLFQCDVYRAGIRKIRCRLTIDHGGKYHRAQKQVDGEKFDIRWVAVNPKRYVRR